MARVLITSGPTREPLDPVRYLSNASSGRMGAALASVAIARGHTVDVVTGPAETPLPAGAHVVRVGTALEMLEACRDLHPRCDILIGAAAVSDYRPREPLAEKRPRRGGIWTIELIPNPDILAELGAAKGRRLHVGFALETAADALALERARRKLARKRLDWVVLNPAGTIGAASGRFFLVAAAGPEIALGELSKADLAQALLDRLCPGGPGKNPQPTSPNLR